MSRGVGVDDARRADVGVRRQVAVHVHRVLLLRVKEGKEGKASELQLHCQTPAGGGVH